MDTEAMRLWAARQDPGATFASDPVRSLSSKLTRFHLDGVPTVAVGSDAGTKVKINAVLDAVSWALNDSPPSGAVHVIVGRGADDKPDDALDAMCAVAASVRAGLQVEVFTKSSFGAPLVRPANPGVFPDAPLKRWAGYLERARTAEPTGVAAELIGRIHHPSAALYPKLSGPGDWQLRLDGLEVGRVGHAAGELALASKSTATEGKPYQQWLAAIPMRRFGFDNTNLDAAAHRVSALIAEFGGHTPGVLDHGQAEHGIEAHVLTGRTELVSPSSGLLHPALPFAGGVLRSAQFPTLWGNVLSPARYLDALMADKQGRPWAVELKAPAVAGGNGSYLRAGITQAILYRYYIRGAILLDPWFTKLGLARQECQAAVAFPACAPGVADRHRKVADLCEVEVIEFTQPGAPQVSTRP